MVSYMAYMSVSRSVTGPSSPFTVPVSASMKVPFTGVWSAMSSGNIKTGIEVFSNMKAASKGSAKTFHSAFIFQLLYGGAWSTSAKTLPPTFTAPPIHRISFTLYSSSGCSRSTAAMLLRLAVTTYETESSSASSKSFLRKSSALGKSIAFFKFWYVHASQGMSLYA